MVWEQLVGQLVVRQQLVRRRLDRELVGHRRLELTLRLRRFVAARVALPAVPPQMLQVAALTSAVAIAAAATFLVAVDRGRAAPAGFAGAFVVVALLLTVTEACPIHLHFRGQAHSLSLSDVAVVLGLFTLTPGELLASQLLGGLVAVLVLRRQRLIKAAFNLALYALTCCVAITVFQTIASHGDTFGLAGWLGALAAAVAAALLGVAVVSLVIRIASGSGMLRELPLLVGLAVGSSVMSASVALIAVQLLHVDARAVWLILGPAAACAAAFYVSVRQRHRHRHTEFLYGAMRRIHEAPDLAGAVRELLSASRDLVAAEKASIVLLPRKTGAPAVTAAAGATSTELAPLELTPAFSLALEALRIAGTTIVLSRNREAHLLDTYLEEIDADDAIVTALGVGDEVAAMLCVSNRGSDVATFTAHDGKLLTAFAQHAGAVLERDRILEELHDMAFTDALTRLPNRARFTILLGDALAAARAGAPQPTVLFVDLDDFKTVNDSLGHTAGDELLGEVARRLRALAPGTAVSRFGGDEFALLATGSDQVAGEFAQEILALFDLPFFLAGREIRIRASIGVAAGGPYATTVEELLRNADVAMYAAKDAGKRAFSLYVPEMHERVKQRQELASALERGVERGELEVHYQPIISLADSGVYALEALARWRHPDLGLLAPGVFIPLAEERGLSAALTRLVVTEACANAAEWRRVCGDVMVSVNVAPSDVVGETLLADVDWALEQAGVPAEALLVEITESAALRDPAVTLAQLAELRARGVRVALDDFGTGYSSLAHLRDLPIDCVKIAKEFVDGLDDHPSGEAFIVAIVRLAESLSLDVVLEGIESPAAVEIAKLHCRYGQGFHYSRPMPGGEVSGYLRRRGQRAWKQRAEEPTALPLLRPAALR
ncbi:MAG TPA: EAL domain-containing protein [Gaiellaceae bacterium]|nr:EAL domain-containing protein [Gaiellaceae bacterium]